jgi:serine O-acetyltransferase
VIIGRRTQIGEYTTISQQVTLGGNFGNRDAEGRWTPRIGAFCWICTGAVVAGPIEVGDYTIVGANAVVTRPVPAYAVVGGVPAKVIRTQDPDKTWLLGGTKKDPSSGRAAADIPTGDLEA